MVQHGRRPAERHETPAERMDRNWDELMQELRVTQTGAQILVGFLLTIPFQQRFTELDDYQRRLYLALVLVAAVATVLIVAPVSLHRLLFQRGLKGELVGAGNLFARAGLVALAVVMVGVPMFLFDVVVSRAAGRLVGGAVLVLIVAVWWALPWVIDRRSGQGTSHPGQRPDQRQD